MIKGYLLYLSIMLVFIFIGCGKPTAEELYNEAVEAQKDELYDLAIEKYQKLVDMYPDSLQTPEAYYAIGVIYQNHKHLYHRAIDVFRQLIEKFPKHPVSPSAAFLIGFIYNNDLKNYDSAKIAYENYIKLYPDDRLVNSAKFELENLGKSPEEILKKQMEIAEEETSYGLAESGKSSKSKIAAKRK